MKNTVVFSILSLICYLCMGCERDDICSSGFQVTPRLIIEFYDINEQDVLKSVTDLSLFAIGDEDTVFIGTANQIEIPLRTNQASTRYGFIRESSDEDISNLDEINFTYATQDIYVNRACGYKTQFIDFQASRIIDDDPSNNWIKSLIIQQTFIDNDQEETHLFIYH